MTNQKKCYSLLLFFICSPLLLSQSKSYIVTCSKLGMWMEPDSSYKRLYSLAEGEIVKLIDAVGNGWSKIEYKDTVGFVPSENITEIDLKDFLGWEKISLSSGDKPDCSNFSPEIDSTIDNYLKVIIGQHADVVLKLMNHKTGKCIRYVYIKRKEITYLRNIPQGVYYLKIAFGKDWRQKIEGDQCIGKFMIDPIYQKGEESLDFNIIETENGYQVPYYELFLDVTYSEGNEFHTDDISESEFNK